MSLLDKIKENSTQSEGKEIYTGICTFIIDAVNPSMDELKALGYNPKQEPVYTGEKDGKTTLRLDFYMSNPHAEVITSEGVKKKAIKTKMTFFLEDGEIVNKAGDKFQFINNYGQTCYATSTDTGYSWFKTDGIRKCRKGEESLILLLYKWLGLTQPYQDKEGDACNIETPWNKLVNGDVKELKSYADACKKMGNGIKVLLGAKETDKDGKIVYYQDVYTKYIMKPGQNSYDGLVKILNDEYSQFKSHYGSDLKLRVFTPDLITPDVENVTESNNQQDSGTDLPF
jgi:hypothetical protein